MINDEKIADRIIYLISDLSYNINNPKVYKIVFDIKKHYIKYLKINDVMNNNWYKIKKGFISSFFYKRKDNDLKILNKIYRELKICYDTLNIDNSSNLQDTLLSDINFLQIYISKLK